MRRGLALIELMIGLGVAALVFVIGASWWITSKERSREAAAIDTLHAIATAGSGTSL